VENAERDASINTIERVGADAAALPRGAGLSLRWQRRQRSGSAPLAQGPHRGDCRHVLCARAGLARFLVVDRLARRTHQPPEVMRRQAQPVSLRRQSLGAETKPRGA
jgi:hypothetical protein